MCTFKLYHCISVSKYNNLKNFKNIFILYTYKKKIT